MSDEAMAPENASSRMKSDANLMLEALSTDDANRAAQAGAAVMGGAIGIMIASGAISPGHVNDVMECLIEIAEEFARAEAMA